METFGLVVTICGGLGTIAALAGAVIKLIKTVSRQQEQLREGMRCLLRSQILVIYYSCKDKGTIRQYQRENADALDAAYVALGGNSFIEDVYEEIRELTVVS